jgi:hypothetical protein
MKFRLRRKPTPPPVNHATPLPSSGPATRTAQAIEPAPEAEEVFVEPALQCVIQERARRGLNPDPGDVMLTREELIALYELNQEEQRTLRGTSGYDALSLRASPSHCVRRDGASSNSATRYGSFRDLEHGLEASEVGGTEDDAIASGHVNQVEVDAGARDLASEIREHTGSVLDLDHDHLALAGYGEMRDRQRVLCCLRVGNENVELGPLPRSHAGRGGDVYAGVADRCGDARQCAGSVFDVDDQVERHVTIPSERLVVGTATGSDADVTGHLRFGSPARCAI